MCLPGLVGKLIIRRDRHGIPLIEAEHDRDEAFGIGFCQGQDRAFQLEILHRVARGSVAELIGPAAVPVDRLARRIGFYRSAREQLALIDSDLRDNLDAYAAGVNAGRSIVPHEMALVGGTLAPWDAADCLAIAKVLSFKLAANWDAELMRLKVLTSARPRRSAAIDHTFALSGASRESPLFPALPGAARPPAIDPAARLVGQAVDRLAQDMMEFLKWAGGGSGSNNWAIAPTRTKTGRPILANDPHLDASLPSHWYLVATRTPGHAVAGASLVGGPVVLAGHNGHIGWGLTAGLIDNTDLFVEEVDAQRQQVRFGSGWQDCRVIEETIAVKGASAVVERVLITLRGPVISPILADTPQSISLCAVWLQPAKVRGLFTLSKARNWESLRTECRFWPVAAQNLAYADTTGAIGWQMIGAAPLRKRGMASFRCWEPTPKQDGTNRACPSRNCPIGSRLRVVGIATANDRQPPEGQGPYLGSDFIDGYRATTIAVALESRHDWDIASTMRLQMDQYTAAWNELRPFVLALEDVPPELRTWDGIASADSRGATVYELWLTSMIRRVAKRFAPKSWEWVVGKSSTALTPYNFGCFRRTSHLVGLLRTQADAWREEMQAALREANHSLPWGEVRQLVIRASFDAGGRLAWLVDGENVQSRSGAMRW
jgi:penicillin amidase